MSNANRHISILSCLVLSMVLVLSSPSLLLARGPGAVRGPRASSVRAGRGAGRHISSGRRYGRHGGSHFSIGFGLSSRYYYTSHRRWVPGRYETHLEKVLVEPGHHEWQVQRVEVEPGYFKEVQIPAVEETRRDAEGKTYTVVIKPTRTETVWVAPKFEERKVQVWVPDRYETREVRVWLPGYWISEPSWAPYPSGSWFSIGGVYRH